MKTRAETTKTRMALIAGATLALIQGCGAGQSERAPASAPAPENVPTASPGDEDGLVSATGESRAKAVPEATTDAPSPAPASAAPQGASASSVAPSAAAPVAPPRASSSDRGSREASIRRASSEIDAAQRALEAAAGDCASACRALGSMDRAAGHLCELASDGDDRKRCESAKTRVQAARDRVRNTCGTCAGGPSVERSAPIPSP